LKIVLVGYMGSGKSTVGGELALNQKSVFLDLDAYIENREGLTIAKIFEQQGELYFRKKEGEYLKEILSLESDVVLATGGGAPCYGHNMNEILKATKNVFYLKLSLPFLVNRLAEEKEQRPLINNIVREELPEFIGKHLFERSFYYNQANTSILCDDKTPQEIVRIITENLV